MRLEITAIEISLPGARPGGQFEISGGDGCDAPLIVRGDGVVAELRHADKLTRGSGLDTVWPRLDCYLASDAGQVAINVHLARVAHQAASRAFAMDRFLEEQRQRLAGPAMHKVLLAALDVTGYTTRDEAKRDLDESLAAGVDVTNGLAGLAVLIFDVLELARTGGAAA